MSRIGDGYGSEWHLLRALANERAKRSRAVAQATGAITVEWLSAPVTSSGTTQEWEGVDFLGPDPAQMRRWAAFWPQRGSAQRWDAVARLHGPAGDEWLLVEAKAHVSELITRCKATAPASIAQIDRAFDATRQSVGADAVASAVWRGAYYQYANRLAALHFLTHICDPPMQARLLFMYFCGDSHPRISGPTDATGWDATLTAQRQALGLDPSAPLMQRVYRLFWPVSPGEPTTPHENNV